MMWLVQHTLPVAPKGRRRSCEIGAVYLQRCVQPPLHGFKHNFSIVYLQRACHRSILFKEMVRFALSDNATALFNAEKDTSLKTLQILFLCHPHACSLLSHLERQKCVLLPCAADHPYPSLCCWKSGGITPSAGCSAAAARLPTARSRISPRPPFPFRHGARRTAH